MDVALEFERGNRLAAQGKFAEAERCYRKILAAQPQLPEVHCNLGNALLDQGKVEPAVESYRRALALRPGFAQAAANLGHARSAGRSGFSTVTKASGAGSPGARTRPGTRP